MERRWGPKIKARGIYRDAVRSSKSHFVKCSGLRWMSTMLLARIPWANQVWALPFLTVLAPSERYHEKQGKRHKTISVWARQICLLLRRWLPDFEIIMLGDGSYAVMELLAASRGRLTWITRFRTDAALYDFPPPYREGQQGRPPIKGGRQPTLEQRLADPSTPWQQVLFSHWYCEENKLMEITSGTAIWYRGGKPAVPVRWVLIRDPEGKLEPMAIQSTNLGLSPIEIVRHYLKRWRVEVTFEEGAGPPRSGDPKTMVRSKYCQDNAGFDGAIQHRRPLGRYPADYAKIDRISNSLVSKNLSDFFGCAGLCPLPNLALPTFFTLEKKPGL